MISILEHRKRDASVSVIVRTSTCSFDQLSMLKDLTFEMCVPSLRCMAAQRMHRNTPRLHDAQAGFREWQSAQRLLPGTPWTSSCRTFSFRAAWRLLCAPDMVAHGSVACSVGRLHGGTGRGKRSLFC